MDAANEQGGTTPKELAAAESISANNGSRTSAGEQFPPSKKRDTNQEFKGIKSAGAMKKRAIKSSGHAKPLTTEQLRDIWGKIRSDPGARRALERLDEAGFLISHLKPQDATFKHPNWADYIAALPLLPNEPRTRRIHRRSSFRKYWPLVRELHAFAAKLNKPFVEVGIFGVRDYPVSGGSSLREDLLKTASMLEHFLSWDYYVRYVNPRNALIAELRWTIRERTGSPHDLELADLIDTSFRAAGYKQGCYIYPTALERIEERQKESRVNVNQRIRHIISASSPSPRSSTRIRRNSRKRV